MGQLAEKDHRPQLPTEIMIDNVKPVSRKKPFIICPFLQFQVPQKIFFMENEDQVQVLFTFGQLKTVHLQLKKQQSKKTPGIYLKLADEYVYAYKHRKLDRSDKIKPQKLLFKRRMYGTQVIETSEKSELLPVNASDELRKKGSKFQENQKKVMERLLLKFAQVKLMSLHEVGPKLGRVYNGCDGVITQEYIQYFSQVTIDRIQNCLAKNSQLKQLQKRLISASFTPPSPLKPQHLSYSRWRKGYVLKQLHYPEPFALSENRLSYDNQSIHFIVRMFETQITKAIMDLDNEAKMLPFINNLIFQHDFERALNKFQESLPMIEDEDKQEFAQEVSSMIAKHSATNSTSKQYEKRIQKIMASSGIRDSSTYNNNSMTTSRNNSSSNIQEPVISPAKEKGSIYRQGAVNDRRQEVIQQQANDLNNDDNPDVLSPISQDNFNLHRKQESSDDSESSEDADKHKASAYNQSSTEQKIVTETPKTKKSLQTKLNSTVNKQLPKTQQDLQPKKTNLPDIKIQQNPTIQISAQQKRLQFYQLIKSLKTSILDKNNTKSYQTLQKLKSLCYKSPIEIQIIFGKLLIESARSRHALAIFQRLLYSLNEIPYSQLYHYHEVALLAGIVYYHRYNYPKALKAFQKALSILVKLKHYSIKMMTVHNNLACVYHVNKDYDKALLHLHRGFRLGEYSVDHEYLMRSNMAMALAQKGKIKEAKQEMLKINKIVEPINNMLVFCKFYSNLAYLELLDSTDSKSLDKAISTFEQACSIEEKYLIPNGYKPSIFLHNNIAMLFYKRKQFKKAKFHSQKILNELNDVEGLVAVKVHFNIGKIFSQGYNYDLPLKHFHEAKVLLTKIDDGKDQTIRRYKEIVSREIQELQRMRIDQVSEEESYKFSYMSSSLLKKM